MPSGILDAPPSSRYLDDMSRVEPSPASLAGQVTDKDPAVGLAAVAALRRLLDELERLHVDNARDQGWSWQDIASALRVSKQAVHEKHVTRRKVTGKE
jgi:hypothetical protein